MEGNISIRQGNTGGIRMIVNKRYKAVMTVEASLVLPLIVFIFLSVMILGMYLHDIIIAKSVLIDELEYAVLTVNQNYNVVTGEIDYEDRVDKSIVLENAMSLVGSDIGKTNEINSINKRIKEKIANSLLICDYSEVIVKSQKGQLSLSVKLTNRLGSFPFINILDEYYTVKESKSVIDESELLRFTQVFLEK